MSAIGRIIQIEELDEFGLVQNLDAGPTAPRNATNNRRHHARTFAAATRRN